MKQQIETTLGPRVLGLLMILSILFSCKNSAQSVEEVRVFDPEYVEVTNERAQKIVDGMSFSSVEQKVEVKQLIAEQYRNLSWIQDHRDEDVETVKNEDIPDVDKEQAIKAIETEADIELSELHANYISSLSALLTPEQVDQVKDGMTYNVLHGTYDGYLDMIPDLSDEEKQYIMDNLVEAREHAMDAGSADMKHWWFGKYKGRINNYLSGRGYDLNQLSQEWHERLEAEKEN